MSQITIYVGGAILRRYVMDNRYLVFNIGGQVPVFIEALDNEMQAAHAIKHDGDKIAIDILELKGVEPAERF